MSYKPIILNFLLLAITTIVGLFITEIIYRYYKINFSYALTKPTGNQYQFYSFDSTLGWKNSPNVAGIYEREEFSYFVSTNEYGMRQDSLNIQKEEKRIAVLGDSFTWGIGVDNEHRFSEILGNKIDSTEVLNFGVSGYSPVHYFLILDEILKFKPDIVIIMFCLSNDFEDNVLFERYGYFKPFAELDDDNGFVISGYPIPNVKQFGNYIPKELLNSWFLGDLLNKAKLLFEGQRGLVGFKNKHIYIQDDKLTEVESKNKSTAIKINEILLSAISEKLSKHGVKFVIASVPTKREYNKSREYYNEGIYFEAENVLSEACYKNSIDFIPLVNRLDMKDFWEIDGHWKPSGHQKAADSIFKFIRANYSY